jgi:hypothetical protein
MADKINNIRDQDLGDILADKLKFHQQELKNHSEKAIHHKQEADFHQERVDYISAVLKDLPPPKEEPSKQEEIPQEELYTKSWWWKKRIKELSPKEEFTRGRLFELDGIVWDDDEDDYKGKVGYSTSMALSELTQEGFLSSRKEAGTKGYLYKVKKIN